MADVIIEKKENGNGTSEIGRGGRGGGADRGRGTPRGRGVHPRGGFTPSRGGFEGRGGRGTPTRGGRGGRGGFEGGFSSGGGYNGNNSMGDSSFDDDIMHQLMEEAEAEKAKEPKKFLGRCRLFVGNLPNDMEESDFEEMFKAYGETSEVFLNKQRGFGFVRLDYLHNAQHAKMKLDNTEVKGRVIRVRFASHGAALKVKYLSPCVSNEMLEQAFGQFGPVERAVIHVDERGRSLGEGVVEFSRKPSAQMAIRRINDGVFLMTSQPRPIQVEQLEGRDEEDGLPEKSVPRNPQFMKERDHPPRFAMPNTFEFDFAQRWKALFDLEKQQREQLETQIKEARVRLQDEESFAIQEWHAQQLRQELEQRQAELKRMEEMQAVERQRRDEDHKRRMEEQIRIREEEARRREDMMRRDEEMRQRQLERIRGGPAGGGGGGGSPAGDAGTWKRGPKPENEDMDDEGDAEGKRPSAQGEMQRPPFPHFEEEERPRGAYPGRGFPRGIGRRPEGAQREDFKRPRWN